MCGHPEREHAFEGEHRVCSRGQGVRISCRVCAEFWARLPAVAALQEFARVLSTPPRPSSFTLT
ncbi:hypothetical protein [Kitasatospora phosalacinea]|nr:hypothetical protein [Kitasatospora phosalacinea]